MSQQRLNGLSMISIENEILEGPNYISPKRLAFQHKFPYLSSFPSLSIRTGRMDPRRMDPRALVADAEYLEEIERARRDLRALIFGKRCAPIMLRLAWNDAATYIAKIKLGGPNGSIRFEDEYTHAANNGLKIAIDLCEEVKSKHPRITYADLYQLAGVVAVEVTGGPNINFVAGRKELHMSPPEGFLPDAKKGSSHLRAVFNRMGFSDKDIVALSGAHTLGRAHSDRSGFDDKAWTKDPLKFDNSYFVELLKGETYKLLKLPTDKALVEDLDFRCYVELYAKDQEAFFKDYAESHKKFSEFGYYQPSYSNPKPNTTVTSVLAQYVPKSITASASFMAQFVLGIAVVATVAILSFFWKSAGNSEAHDGLHSSLKNNYYGCPPTICQVQPSYSKVTSLFEALKSFIHSVEVSCQRCTYIHTCGHEFISIIFRS